MSYLNPNLEFTVDGSRKILVFDELFSTDEVSNFAAVIGQLDYERRKSFDNELNCNIEKDAFMKAPFLYPTLEGLFRAHAPCLGVDDPSVGLSHVYASAVSSRNSLAVHQDTPRDQAVSFLYYGNPAWKRDWSGETVFYDSRGESVAAIIPRPGRLAMFHSNIFHRGGAPHDDAPVLRYSVACFFYPGCAQVA